mgnify:CR=1 FL=1
MKTILEVNMWIKIKDKLPELNQRVLVTAAVDGRVEIAQLTLYHPVMKIEDPWWRFDSEFMDELDFVEAWQPLPKG